MSRAGAYLAKAPPRRPVAAEKAVRVAEGDPALRKRLSDQMEFDEQIVDVIHFIKPPENLRQKLSEEAERFPDRENVAALMVLIDRRRCELQDEALKRGDDLYKEGPGVFVRRIAKYWRAWHSTATV